MTVRFPRICVSESNFAFDFKTNVFGVGGGTLSKNLLLKN